MGKTARSPPQTSSDSAGSTVNQSEGRPVLRSDDKQNQNMPQNQNSGEFPSPVQVDVFDYAVNSKSSDSQPLKRKKVDKNTDSLSDADDPTDWLDKLSILRRAVVDNTNLIGNLNFSISKLVRENKSLREEIRELKNYSIELLSCFRTSNENPKLKDKVAELVENNQAIHKEVTEIKSQNKIIVERISNPPASPIITASIPSFADILKTPQNHAIIIKPKNSTQKNEQTMEDIRKNISPTSASINYIKKVSKGAVVIECGQKEDIAKLKTAVYSSLGANYDVSIPEKRKPKIRAFGLYDKLAADEIVKKLLLQNSEIFVADSKIEVVHIFSVSKSTRHGFKLVTDSATHERILKNGKLRVGWDLCSVSEDLDVRRCFNCCGFNHSKEKCTSTLCCPKCTGSHLLKDCQSPTIVCVNCKNSNDTLHLGLDVNHLATSLDCPVFIRRAQQQRRITNYKDE